MPDTRVDLGTAAYKADRLRISPIPDVQMYITSYFAMYINHLQSSLPGFTSTGVGRVPLINSQKKLPDINPDGCIHTLKVNDSFIQSILERCKSDKQTLYLFARDLFVYKIPTLKVEDTLK